MPHSRPAVPSVQRCGLESLARPVLWPDTTRHLLSPQGNLVAVGTHKGFVQIWDAAAGKKLSVLEGHTARVGEQRQGARLSVPCVATALAGRPHPPLPAGALAWNADQLSSGSRDRMILQRDIRTPPLQSERRLQGHRQEVCGLKWSTDHQLLASGGNDNKVWPVLQAAVAVRDLGSAPGTAGW